MNNIANLLIDLLCHVTFEPQAGHDPDDTTDLQINSWQTLLNDLNSEEKEAVNESILNKINWLKESERSGNIKQEQNEMLKALEAYINGEMQ